MQTLDDRLDSLGIVSLTLYRTGRTWRAVAGARSGAKLTARSTTAAGIADALEAAAIAARLELPELPMTLDDACGIVEAGPLASRQEKAKAVRVLRRYAKAGGREGASARGHLALAGLGQ